MNLLRTSSQKRLFRSVIVYFLTFCMFFNASLPVVLAGPDGAVVVNGNVSIQQSGYNTTITASDRAIINYSSFDISRPEIVQFIQPDTSASVLNRILSANPTNINGTLLANGRVFFVNPAGVYFGNGAQVNVNQLVASALNITDADFINGRYNFVGGEGSVINEGDIFAEKVYLIGRQVANSGSISCPSGYVVMASGDRVFLGEPGTDIVLEIEGPSLPESADPIEGSGVLNEGTVEAAGGTIILAAAGDIYSQAISNVGSLSVSNDAGNAGQIKLAAADGDVTNTGTIDASGSEGGQIAMEGARIGQFGIIHADGTDSHGGSVDLTASEVVALSSDSLTTANAGTNGDGGDVIIWADGVTRFYGNIEARGGAESGDGGFAEVSGQTLIYRGHSDLGAPVGNAGTLLLDPGTITIAGGTADGDDDEAGDLSTLLEDNTVTGQVAGDADPSAFTVYESEIEGTDAHIVLEAYDGISTSGDFGDDQLLIMNDRDLTLRTRNDAGDADTGINLTSSDEGASLEIKTQGTGSITIETGVLGAATPQEAPITLCQLNASGTGNIDIGATGDVAVNGAINSGGALSINGSSVNLDAALAVAGVLSGSNSSINVLSNNASIQDAIDIAAPGAAVTVLGDTYDEQLLIDKSLTLDGSSQAAILQSTAIPTAGVYDVKVTSSDVVVQDFTLDFSGSADDRPGTGIVVSDLGGPDATNVQILNNEIYTGDGSALGAVTGSGTAIQTGKNADVSDLLIQGNTIHGDADGMGEGVYINPGPGTGITINNNVIDGYLFSGVSIEASNVEVTNNEINSNLTDGIYGIRFIDLAGGQTFSNVDIGTAGNGNEIQNFQYGIRVGTSGNVGSTLTATITDNTISNNDLGIWARYGTDLQINSISGNSFTNNTKQVHRDAGTLNIADTLANNTFDKAVTVDTGGGVLLGSIWSNIQDGVDAASATETVNVEAGTYAESATTSGTAIDIHFKGDSTLSGSMTAVGLTFSGVITADGAGSQTFDAGGGTLHAWNTITKTGTGGLNLTANTLVDLDNTVDVQSAASDLVVTGTVVADGLLKATGDIDLKNGATLGGNVTSVGGDIDFRDTVSADGGAAQTFDAGGGTLHAWNTITKTGTGGLNLTANTLVDLDNTVDVQSAAGDLVVTGTVDADDLLKATGNIDLKNGATLGGNVTSVGGNIDFRDTVSANGGATQTFDAGGGTLHAWNTITKTGTGGLNLTANTLVDLDNTVDVQSAAGDLVVTGTVVADGLLKATGDIDLKNGATLGGNVTSVGGNIDFRDTVSADGGAAQTFDAGGGTLHAWNTITKTGTGGLNLTANTLVDLDDTVDVQSAAGDLVVTGTVVADGLLKATGDIDLKNAATLGGNVTSVGGNIDFRDTVSADGGAAQTFDAGGGTLHAWNTITKTGTGGLNLTANTLVDLDDTVDVQSAAGDLVVTGTVVADGLLKATGDIDLKNGATLGGNVTSVGGDIDFRDTVSADGGAAQTFDAGGGTLHAWNTITKTGTGGLNLTANTLVDLDNTVDVQSAAGDLVVTGTVDADDLLKATGNIDLKNGATLGGNVTSVGGNIDFRDTVSANGGATQTFDAGGGTLHAWNTITKTGTGGLNLTANTLVDLDNTVDVQSAASDLVVTGTVVADGLLKATGDIDLKNGAILGGNVTSVGGNIDFRDTVSADGGAAQTFDAGGGTLHAWNTITKTGTGGLNLTANTLVDLDNTVDVQSAAGDLVVTGTVVADDLLKATGDIDLKNGATLGGNVTSVGGNIDFRDTVSADGGAAQTFDAGGGTLHAWNTITKTGTGGLNLTANTLVDLDNTVDVQSAAGDLVVTGTVDADDLLKATGNIDLKNGATLGGNVTSVGGNIDFRDTVSADGGDQVFDAEGGTLTTNNGISITKTTAGTLSLGGATALNLGGDVKATAAGGNLVFTDDVTASGAGSQEFDAEGGTLTAKSITKAAGDLTLGGATDIDLDGTVDVQGGNLNLEDNVTVADEEMLKASGNVTVAAGKTLTTEGHLKVEATGGAITAGLITMQADDKTLTLTQNDAIDMAAFSVTNSGNTDLVANSTDGSVTSSTADSWQSITAEAKDNIELLGTGDIKIATTGLLSHEGGVKVVSNGGSIYTPGAGGYLNAPITGYSDESADVGVDLIYPYWPEFGTKAAIVIWSPYKDLKIGPDATLTANGTYDPTQFDDRLSFLVDFFTPTDLRGDPVDVAIYLGSNYSGNVDMGSGSVWIDNKSLTEIGTLAIDAYDTVTFTEAFENSLPGSTVRRLEVISRSSEDVSMAIANEALPYVDNPSLLADGLYLGTYVLRGRDLLFTQVLKKREEAPIVPPKLEEPEEQGAVEEPDMEALIALLEELGIGVQPHLARAFRHEKSGINTLNTDLRLFKAAEKLQKLIPMLEDTEGRRIAALRVVVGQSFSTLASISDEQMASFRQELALHVGDGTDYDLAGQTISSLTGYVEILSTDIGWPTDRSMAFVMGRYIPRLTEGDAIRTAVVQIRMQEALGI